MRDFFLDLLSKDPGKRLRGNGKRAFRVLSFQRGSASLSGASTRWNLPGPSVSFPILPGRGLDLKNFQIPEHFEKISIGNSTQKGKNCLLSSGLSEEGAFILNNFRQSTCLHPMFAAMNTLFFLLV